MLEVDIPQRLLKGSQEYLPVIAAYYAGFMLASRFDLRFWIAAKRASKPTEEAEEPKRCSKIKKFLIFLFVVGLSVVVGYLAATTLQQYLLLLLVPLVTSSTWPLINRIIPFARFSAHRNQDGVVSIMYSQVNKGALIWGLLISLAVTGGSLGTGSKSASLAVLSGLVYRTSSRMNPGNPRGTTFVRTALFALGFSAYIVTLFAIGFYFAQSYSSKSQENRDNLKKNLDELDNIPVWAYYQQWILPGIFAATQGSFLSLLLRYDYARFCEANPDIDHSIELEEVHPTQLATKRAKKVGKFGIGAVLPKSIPAGFSKPFYITATTIGLLTHLGLAAFLSIASPDKDGSILPGFSFALLAMPCVLNNIVFYTLVNAWFRGELKKLWRFKDKWVESTAAEAVIVANPADVKEVIFDEKLVELEP